jgi:Protein of unknown function (DUF3631)
MTILDFLERFSERRHVSGQWLVRCPSHDDQNASLAVREAADGSILLKCHAGCPTDAILAVLRLTQKDLFPERQNGGRREVVNVYDYFDEAGEILYQTVRYRPKGFSQRQTNGHGGWIPNMNGVRRVVYQLHKIQRQDAVVIVEGEKDVDALWNTGIPATCNVGGAGKWRDDYSAQLCAAGVKTALVIPDNDDPGRAHGEQVGQSCVRAGLAVKLAMLPDVPEKGDVSDYLAGHSKADLIAVLEAATPYLMPVAQVLEPTAYPPQSQFVAPNTAAVLEALIRFMVRFLVLTDDQVLTVALWVMHCHTFEAAETTPYLSITSAVKQSGKTRVLEVTELVVPRPWLTGRASAAVLVRKIDRETPTLLLDESDAAFKQSSEYSEALRAILNAGFRRGGKASMCVKQGSDYVARDFDTFCPKAIAGIGSLPDTVADRSIPIRIRRRLPSEPLDRFRDRVKTKAAAPVRRMLESWAAATIPLLRQAEPTMPDGMRDRAADVWEPLIAIADSAGAEWGAKARAAAIRLSGGAEVNDDNPAVQLLADIRTVFDDETRSEFPSTELVERLKALDDRPWGEWGRHAKGLTTAAFAKLVSEFGVFPTDPVWVVVDGKRKQRRCYRRAVFEDAFARVLGSEPSKCNNVIIDGRESKFPNRNISESVTPAELPISSINTARCYGVTSVSADLAAEPSKPLVEEVEL